MRTYEDIYKDFLKWVVETTGKLEYEYDTFMSSDDPEVLKPLLYKTILEKCYDNDNGFFYFMKFIIGDLKELGYPRPLRYNSLFRKFDKLNKQHKHLAIQCARGHGKSLFFSQLYQIYDMFLFKSKKILVESASQEQADLIIEEIRRVIDNNEWLKTKKNPDKWRTSMLGFNNGFIMGKGFGSEVLGLHIDRIVVDDILRSDNKLSPEEIEDFIDMVLEPMILNRNGQMILVGTPKNEKDIFSTIEKRIRDGSNWKMYKFPAIIDYDKKVLQCPDRFTWEELMDKRLSMGALKFGREYQLELFSRDKSLFPDYLLKHAKDKGKDLSLMDKIDKRSDEWSIVAGVDVARSGSASADFSVMIVLAYNYKTQEKQVVHVWREKGLKISIQAERIAEIAKNFGNCYVLVEQNNMGQDMIDELAGTFNVNVDSFVTGGKGQKKDELIRFLINSLEHEQLTFPMGDDWSREVTRELVDELEKFGVTYTPAGNEKYEALSGKDDQVMALALANKATQMVGIPFAVSFDGKGSSMPQMPNLNKSESDLVNMIRQGLIK